LYQSVECTGLHQEVQPFRVPTREGGRHRAFHCERESLVVVPAAILRGDRLSSPFFPLVYHPRPGTSTPGREKRLVDVEVESVVRRPALLSECGQEVPGGLPWGIPVPEPRSVALRGQPQVVARLRRVLRAVGQSLPCRRKSLLGPLFALLGIILGLLDLPEDQGEEPLADFHHLGGEGRLRVELLYHAGPPGDLFDNLSPRPFPEKPVTALPEDLPLERHPLLLD